MNFFDNVLPLVKFAFIILILPMKRTKVLVTVLMASLMLSYSCSDGVKKEKEYVNSQGHVVHNPSFFVCWFPSWYGYSTRTVYIHHTPTGTVTRSYTPPARSSYSGTSSSRGGWGRSSFSSAS